MLLSEKLAVGLIQYSAKGAAFSSTAEAKGVKNTWYVYVAKEKARKRVEDKYSAGYLEMHQFLHSQLFVYFA